MAWALAGLTCCVVFVFFFLAAPSPPHVQSKVAERKKEVGEAEAKVPTTSGEGGVLMDPSLFQVLDSSKDGILREGEIAWEMQKRIGRHIKK